MQLELIKDQYMTSLTGTNSSLLFQMGMGVNHPFPNCLYLLSNKNLA